MRAGALSGVVSDALRFAYEGLRGDTLASEAELDIEEIPASYWCQNCEKEVTAGNLLFECPCCRNPCGQLRRGNELELTSLEIS